MIDKKQDLPLVRQAKLLNLSRGSLYYEPKGPSQHDLDIMCEIDRLHMEYPFMGARMLRDTLKRILVSLRRDGLGNAPNSRMATLEYADHGLLHRRR